MLVLTCVLSFADESEESGSEEESDNPLATLQDRLAELRTGELAGVAIVEWLHVCLGGVVVQIHCNFEVI